MNRERHFFTGSGIPLDRPLNSEFGQRCCGVTGNYAAYLSSADRGGQCCSSILLEQSDVEAS